MIIARSRLVGKAMSHRTGRVILLRCEAGQDAPNSAPFETGACRRRHEEPERWNGAVKQDGNVGRTDVLAGGTVGYTVGPTLILLSIKVPVWQRFLGEAHEGSDPGQLTYPAIANLAVHTRLGAGRR